MRTGKGEGGEGRLWRICVLICNNRCRDVPVGWRLVTDHTATKTLPLFFLLLFIIYTLYILYL